MRDFNGGLLERGVGIAVENPGTTSSFPVELQSIRTRELRAVISEDHREQPAKDLSSERRI